MASIHVFDGIGSSHRTYSKNGVLRDVVDGVDWTRCVVLRGGYRVTPDYRAVEDDVIFIRQYPGAMTAVAVGLVAAAVVGGILLGYQLYKQKKMLAQLQGAMGASKSSKVSETEKLPFVKGASNMAATGQTFPFVMGETLFTPYRLCPAHYTIAGARGETQYYNVVLECGFNDLVIRKLMLKNTVVRSWSEDAPQDGVYGFDPGLYYDSRNLVEIRQSGDFETAEFNRKIVLTELSTEIPHDHAGDDALENARIEREWQQGVVQELAGNPMAVEVIVLFDGLRRFGDDDWVGQTVTLQPQWTNNPDDDAPVWRDFDRGFNQNGTYSNTFTYNSRRQMRFSATQAFTPGQAYGKKISVRLRRTSPKASNSSQENVYLIAVQTTCYDAVKSGRDVLVPAKPLEDDKAARCTRMGIRVVANENTSDMLESFSVIEQGVARTWDGSGWSEDRRPTRNLAAWALELLTSPHHRASRYDDGELDLGSFGEWYEYCERMGFHADGVITKSVKKRTTLETLFANGNAALLTSEFTGKLEVAIDNGRDWSVALLNGDNIVSMESVKEFKRRSDGKKVTYVNRDSGYEVDSVTFMRDGGAYDPEEDTLTETALNYITDYAHAFKCVWRQMAEEEAQPRTVTVKVGEEGAYYPLFSRVELQHRSLAVGIGHAIVRECTWWGGMLRSLRLDRKVSFPGDRKCGVIVNATGGRTCGICALKVMDEDGAVDVLRVETRLPVSADVLPGEGDLLSFGALDDDGNFTTVTSAMKIVGMEPAEGGYSLTLKDYNAALYEYGKLPEYRSNVTSVPEGSSRTVESQREYPSLDEMAGVIEGKVREVAEGITAEIGDDVIQQAVEATTHGVVFSHMHHAVESGLTLEGLQQQIDQVRRDSMAGISITNDQILLQVQDEERQLRSVLAMTAGTITALVEGGGNRGQMSLSLELPVMVDSDMRERLVGAAGEDAVAAVYARLDGVEPAKYAIKGNATDAQVKALWDRAVAAGLIASQIDLNATQMRLSADHVFVTDSSGEKVTLIEGDRITTALIDAQKLLAQEVAVKGRLYSDNYYDEHGNPTGEGFMIDGLTGDIEVNDGYFRGEINATSGNMKNVTADTINAINGSFSGELEMKKGIIANNMVTKIGFGPYAQDFNIVFTLNNMGLKKNKFYMSSGGMVYIPSASSSIYYYILSGFLINQNNSVTFYGFPLFYCLSTSKSDPIPAWGYNSFSVATSITVPAWDSLNTYPDFRIFMTF